MLRSVIIKGKDWGAANAVRMFDLSEASESFFQMSFVFVSPNTGSVWATLPVMNGDKVKPFACLSVPGPGEPSRGGYPAGSLLSAGPELIRQLPSAAIEREFWLHLNHYSKETENEVK